MSNGKCEYKGVKVNNKYFFDCETVAEAKEIAIKFMNEKGDYALFADLGKKRPNGDTLFEVLYKFRDKVQR